MVTERPVKLRSAKGFTLVELMIGASLSSVIALGVITSFTFLGRNLVRLANNSDLQSRASIATVTLQKDIAKATAVNSVGTTAFTFTIDKDGVSETITYNWNSTTGEITRTDSDNSYIVLRKVVDCVFTYSDSDSDPTTVPTAVKKVEFDATTATGTSSVGTYVTHNLVAPAMIIAASSS